MIDAPEDVARDIRAVARIGAIPALLRVLCEMTGMGFAAVARVSAGIWTACAVVDEIGAGTKPGKRLDVESCIESHGGREPIFIDHVSRDPRYAERRHAQSHSIESYASVPILLAGGRCFGQLCAMDPHPARVSDPKIVSMFNHFAEIISLQLDHELARDERGTRLDERASSELREQLNSILGHDLRNPLQAVSASGELLARKLTDPALRNIAARIKVNVRRMSGLIDDVLDFARGRLGEDISLKISEVTTLNAELAAVVTEFRVAEPQRRIESLFAVERAVWCDLGRIQQLASKLLANSLTHGAAGGAVEIRATISDDALIIEVWNAGTPIPDEDLRRIFQPCWRQSTSTNRKLGLGLYICSQIVRAHGGRLSVVSTAASGTRFTAHLPLRGAAATSA